MHCNLLLHPYPELGLNCLANNRFTALCRFHDVERWSPTVAKPQPPACGGPGMLGVVVLPQVGDHRGKKFSNNVEHVLCLIDLCSVFHSFVGFLKMGWGPSPYAEKRVYVG